MAARPFRVLSLCSGVGGLDIGLRIAVPTARTLVYVEREAYAAACLVARMEESAMDQGLVWDDLLTFDGAAWRGAIDCVIAGWPCPPASVAGKRLGTADERWIWPAIVRVLSEVQPGWFFGENVPGLLSVNGGLAFRDVLRDLAALGFDAEWGLFSAAEVGAPQRRERLFILGMAHAMRSGRQQDPRSAHGDEGPHEGWAAALGNEPSGKRADVAHAECGDAEQPAGTGTGPREAQGAGASGDASGCSAVLADAQRAERRAHNQHGRLPGGREQGAGGTDSDCGALANATHDNGRRGVSGPQAGVGPDGERRGRPSGCDSTLEHTHEPGQPGHVGHDGADERPPFPPGPADRDGWAAVLERWPHLAPALTIAEEDRYGVRYAFASPQTQPEIRGVAPELAGGLGNTRADQLRVLGNGVVPLQAAVAFTVLYQRLMQAT